MNVLEVNQVVVPDGYVKVVVKSVDDIPYDEETVGYEDNNGDVFVLFDGGVYIWECLK